MIGSLLINQYVDRGIVFMGNNVLCKIVSIGTIRIKIHDGILRTLEDVHHVSDLKMNLTSLNTLNSQG